MKLQRRLLLVLGVLGVSPAFASSLCTGTIQQMISSGVCQFDGYSIDITGFSTGSSTYPNLLNASQISVEASVLPNGVADIVFNVSGSNPFFAGNAAAGGSVLADYQIAYTLTGPGVFTSESEVVGGGAVTLPGSYTVTTTGDGVTVIVKNTGSQTSSANLPGTDGTISVLDDISLTASTTQGTKLIPPRAGSASIGTVTDQFTAIPEPMAFLLCGGGLLALGVLKHRKYGRG